MTRIFFGVLFPGSDLASPVRKAPAGTQESVWHGRCTCSRCSKLLRVQRTGAEKFCYVAVPARMRAVIGARRQGLVCHVVFV